MDQIGTQDQEEAAYEPQDAIGKTVRMSLQTGAGGLFVATIQNTLARRQGAFGVFAKYGPTTAWFGTPTSHPQTRTEH